MQQFISWINLFTTTKWVVICSNALINCIFQDLFLWASTLGVFRPDHWRRECKICLKTQALLIWCPCSQILRETDKVNYELFWHIGVVPRMLRGSDSCGLFRFPLSLDSHPLSIKNTFISHLILSQSKAPTLTSLVSCSADSLNATTQSQEVMTVVRFLLSSQSEVATLFSHCRLAKCHTMQCYCQRCDSTGLYK